MRKQASYTPGPWTLNEYEDDGVHLADVFDRNLECKTACLNIGDARLIAAPAGGIKPMRHHAYDDAPDYLRAEVGAQRRYERQKSKHPLCNDPDHPGCKHCEPEMFPTPVPEGYMTRAEFVALRRKQLDQLEQQADDDQLRCEAGWAEIEYDFLSTWGMK